MLCGDYELVPFYADEVTTFDVIPQQVKLRVGAGSGALKNPFKVNGFSVKGRVVTTGGEGIPGVTVSATGLTDALTDSDGYYSLTGVTSGCYLH